MRLIKAIVVLGLCVAGFGFYRGWFSLSSQRRDADSNKVDVTLTADPDKAKADAELMKDKTLDLGHRATNKVQSVNQ